MTIPIGQYAEFQSPDQHRFRAFVATPAKPPRAALVLLHEMDSRWISRVQSSAQANPRPGLSQRIRALVTEHAARGYLVVAPSLFGRGRAGRDHGYQFQLGFSGVQLVQPLQPVDSSRALMDVQTVLTWAQSEVGQGRVGIMGFCWGGLLAWQAACSLPQVFAAVSFYGGGMTLAQARNGRPMCPVLVHLPAHGEWMTQASMDEFVAAQRDHFSAHGVVSADEKTPMVQIERCDAGYGFDHAGSRLYDPMASRTARQASGSFFDKYLKN